MKILFEYEGIIRDGVKIYFIEVIEYTKQAACRFLVTTKNYPELREYDPTKKGGPLYYDSRNGHQFYYLTHIKSSRYEDRILLTNTVEIMKDQRQGYINPRYIKRWCYENHFISFTHCQWPKNVSTIECCAKCDFPKG